jgi:hypothetical protein
MPDLILVGRTNLRIMIVEAWRPRGPYAVVSALFNAGFRGHELAYR